MKKIIIPVVLLLSGCGFFAKPSPQIAFHYELKPIDLSAYKTNNIVVGNNQICMPTDDYTNQIKLLNTLANYIQYQRTVITDMNNYYTKK